MTNTKIDAAILAGGKSSRMGSDKSVLKVGGQKMIARVLAACREVAERCFVITNAPEQHAFLGVEMFADIEKGIGPLGGVHAALSHARTSQCLIVACDLPFLRADILKKLAAACGGESVCAAKSSRGPEPLCAVYAKSCLPEIDKRIAKKQLSMMGLLKALPLQLIDISAHAEKSLMNINTRTDLQQAQEVAEKQ